MVTSGERCGGSIDCEFGTDKHALLYLKYKSLLLKVKEESEKADLKLNIKKTKIMAFGPITLWQLMGKQCHTLFFLSSKITADCNCSHDIKRQLLLGIKVMTNIDSILKSRDIAKKGPSSQDYCFSSSHVWI